MRGGGRAAARLGPARPARGRGHAPIVRRTSFHYGERRGARPDQAAATASPRCLRRGAPCSTACSSTRRERGRRGRLRHAGDGPRARRRRPRRGRRGCEDGRRQRAPASAPASWSAPTACARPWRGSSGRRRHAPGRHAAGVRLRLLSRARDRRLPLALRARGERRRDPDERRPHAACSPAFRAALPRRGARATSPPASRACSARWRRSWPQAVAARAPLREPARLRRPAGLPAPAAAARAGRSSATPPTSRTRSPPTASPTRCATPSSSPTRCSRARSGVRPLRGAARRGRARHLRAQRPHRVVRVEPAGARGDAPRAQRGDEARGARRSASGTRRSESEARRSA